MAFREKPSRPVSYDVRVPDPKGLERSGMSLLSILRATPGYASLPAVIFTGMPLSLEEEDTARHLDAQVFYKPQRFAVLVEHLPCHGVARAVADVGYSPSSIVHSCSTVLSDLPSLV